jgi:hypothetical protein
MTEFKGELSLSFDQPALVDLCRELIPMFDADRFEIVALRLYGGKELVFTVYAEDKETETTTIRPGRYPVKKFKLEISSPSKLYEIIQGFNFTVVHPEYNLGDMEVINR